MSLPALDLDFAERAALPRAWALALLVAGALVLTLVLLQLSLQQRDLAALRAELDDAQRASRHDRAALRPAGGAQREADAQELARANQVVAALNLGWSALFRQLEAVRVPGVTLLAVQPEAGSTRRLRLSGEARRLEEALAYVKQVTAAPGFANAHLVSHELWQEGGRSALHFSLLVEWTAPP